MFKQLYNEASITLRIEPDGPILIKASESGADPTRPDMEFVRTIYKGQETVYLPGSSLKGVLRAHCERLARTVQADAVAGKLSERRLSCDPLHASLSCGQQWEEEKRQARQRRRELSTAEIYQRSCFVCRLFGNTALASHLRLTDAYPRDTAEVRTEERNGVAIDRVFGSVAVGPFNYETATAGAFVCAIQMRNFTVAQLGLLALALRDLEVQRLGVGFAKSRGLGRVQASVQQVTFRYPACTLNGTLTLLGQDRPGSAPTTLAGVGSFAPDEGYGLQSNDALVLPAGLTLIPDDWAEPALTLTGDTQAAQITSLWRECARAWRQTVERLEAGT
jgi:CRISPR-associated RAMP protein (TIGR02581 family)